jgi:hypothetical protein
MTICVCKSFQVRPHAKSSLGSVIDEWMLKTKKRAHVDACNCHEPALHETAEKLFFGLLPHPCQPDRIGATGKSGGKSADRLLGGLP